MTIKEVQDKTIQFLRQHYRYRDRHPEGRVAVSTNQTTESGIVVDGLIRFKLDTDKEFVATFEATTVESREEIKYKIDRRLLVRDVLAVGMMLTAITLVLSFYMGWMSGYYGNYVGFWSLVLLTALVMVGLSWFGLSFLRRYRYIFAIRQFGSYEVDEQWIAYDSAVFIDAGTRKNKYLAELEFQCTKNGIGLIRIDGDDLVAAITPARKYEDKDQAKRLFFFDRGSIEPSTTSKNSGIMRYRKNVLNQFIFMSAAVVIIGYVYYQFNLISPVREYSEGEFQQVLQQNELGIAEGDSLWVEPEFMLEFKERLRPYLEMNREITVFVQQKVVVDSLRPSPRMYVLADDPKLSHQDLNFDLCHGIPTSNNAQYVIQLGAYKRLDNAKQRKIMLNEVGISTELYNCGCLGSNERLHCVLYVHPQPNIDTGLSEIKRFENLLVQDSVAVGEIWLRAVKEL